MQTDQGSALYRIVYDSVVALPFGEEGERGLQAILAAARARNADLAVTGVLYCDGAHFMQVLEGPRHAVEAVFASIASDPRHTDVRIVGQDPITHRSFPAWHMAWLTEEEMALAQARHPDLPAIRPYRGADVVATLRRVLDDQLG